MIYILAEILILRFLALHSEAKEENIKLWENGNCTLSLGGKDVNLSTKYIPGSWQANISRDKSMQLSSSVPGKREMLAKQM